MKSTFRFALIFAALAAVSIIGARAATITYEIQFTNPGFLADYGSGSLTLDDTPHAPHYLSGPSVVGYDFVGVTGTGSGAPGFGPWLSSWLDYDPVTGWAMWNLQLEAKGFDCQSPATPGLSPSEASFEAFEDVMIVGPRTGWWTWERSATPVPTPESCSAAVLIGIGLATLGALGLVPRQGS